MKKSARIIFAILILVMLTACGSKDNKLRISQNANGSSGAEWKYEINPNGILKEIDYSESKFLGFLGPGYTQHWVFEPVALGEVTINWTSYEAGTDIVESECYYITYSVDENLKITKIFDSRNSSQNVTT